MTIVFEVKQGIAWDNFREGTNLELSIDDIIVSSVHDGDSLKEGKTAFRLLGVDTPEIISNHITKNQPLGVEIGNIMRSMIKGKVAKVTIVGTDKYSRVLAKVTVDNLDLSEFLLLNGYAWYLSTPIVSDRTPYKKARDTAKNSKLGIWGLQEPAIKPSEWRKTYWKE